MKNWQGYVLGTLGAVLIWQLIKIDGSEYAGLWALLAFATCQAIAFKYRMERWHSNSVIKTGPKFDIGKHGVVFGYSTALLAGMLAVYVGVRFIL